MATSDVRYPEVRVQLVGKDGNAFAIFGRVNNALKEAGVSKDVRDEFLEEATSADYENLLAMCARWVTVY